MSVFLLVSIVTLALYEALTLGRPAWTDSAAFRYRAYATTVLLLAIGAFFLAAWAISATFYPPFGVAFFISEVLFRKLSGTIFLGFTFGIVSGILLNSLLLGPPRGTLSTFGKLL